jgi:phosphoacetylglucosamine mutase
MMVNLSEVRRLLEKYDYDDAIHDSYYGYGTAGFRYFANELPPIMVRVGLAVALLTMMREEVASSSSSRSVLGIMVTASHNTEEYNGVKLAGSDGGMIDSMAEQFVVDIVNERDIERIVQRVVDIQQQQYSFSSNSNNNNNKNEPKRIIYLGMDTREHSVSLSCLVQSAIRAVAAADSGDHHHHHHHHGSTNIIDIVHFGQVTTPQLHFLVRQTAAVHGIITIPTLPAIGLDGYFQSMVQSYQVLIATKTTASSSSQRPNKNHGRKLYVDCANGVGYPHVQRLQKQFAALSFLVPRNGPGDGPLNDRCGSEYVQKNQTNPCWYNDDDESELLLGADDYCASFDGDADRIVFFKGSILLDGDKIACLIGNFIRKQLDTLLLVGEEEGASTTTTRLPTLGVVQTAYANGASTDYLRTQNVDVTLAKTGVKYVHAAAHERYDIGVYFEANGHGTVLFGAAYYELLHQSRPTTIAGRRALLRLQALPTLVNQAVGDAISDLLLVDAILQIEDCTVEQWSQLYQDLPSKQTKVTVPDRTMIATNETETRCVRPEGLQAALDRAMAQHDSAAGAGTTTTTTSSTRARVFIRPSGTENVVRVYAEATSNADGLASAAEDIVRQFCGGGSGTALSKI